MLFSVDLIWLKSHEFRLNVDLTIYIPDYFRVKIFLIVEFFIVRSEDSA